MLIYGLYVKAAFWIVVLLFFVLLALIYVLRKELWRIFLVEPKAKRWIFLIILISFLVRLWYPHTFIMYVDEPYYLGLAKNIDSCQQFSCFEGDKSLGLKGPVWPVILYFSHYILNIPFEYLFYVTTLIGIITIYFVYVLLRIYTGSESGSILGSFIFAFHPVFIRWYNTIETNGVMITFAVLSLLFFHEWIKNKNHVFLFLLSTVFLIMLMSRYESVLLLFYFAFVLLQRRYQLLTTPQGLYFQLILTTVIALIFARLSWGFLYLGPKSREFLAITIERTIHLSVFLMMPFLNSLTVSLFLLIPLAVWISYDHIKRSSSLYLMLILIIIFSFPHYMGYQCRYVMLPALFLCMIIADSFSSRKKSSLAGAMIVIIILTLFFGIYQSDKEMDYEYLRNQLQKDMIFESRVHIGPEDIIITKHPDLLSGIYDQKIISTEEFINSNYHGVTRFVFFVDMYCTGNPAIIARSVGIRNSLRDCNSVLSYLDIEEYIPIVGRYGLYKGTNRAYG